MCWISFVWISCLCLVIGRSVVHAEAGNLPFSEINALQCLYDSTDGSNWAWTGNEVHWNFSGDPNPCTDAWYGVDCSPEGNGTFRHVLSLSLNSFNLVGTLPPQLGNLAMLDYLNLVANGLIGSLPPTLGNLTSLSFLLLSVNRLTGSLPPALGNLTALIDLYLDNNTLIGALPPQLGGMSSLSILSIKNNLLSGPLPPELGDLTELTVMDLYHNQLTGPLPPELGDMTTLTYIFLSSNHLTGSLPPELGNLKALVYLELYSNRLTGSLPPELSGMTLLFDLYLYDNLLTGTIPPELGDIDSLIIMDLENNRLTGSLPELGDIPVLSLGTNLLEGTIPAGLLGSQSLQVLQLSSNVLSGPLLNLPCNLTDFLVADNGLTGCLPSFSVTTLLQEVDVSHNQLSCSLAGVFGSNKINLPLLNVQLQYNKFSGTLPPELFQLPYIQTVVAISNCFTGTLPAELCQAQFIQSLILDGLGASSSCPTTWTTWQQEGVFRVLPSFRGTIPSCVFGLPNLTSLHLSGNNLMGSIPEDVVLSQRLTQLYLSHNRLSGSLPDQMQTHAWYQLDVSYNRFGGTLLPTFGNGTLAQQHQFAGNSSILINNSRISGSIPATVLQLSSISMLGSNMFSCKADKSDVPDTDGNGDKQRYQCGSDGFNYAFYLFLGLSGLALAAMLWMVYIAPTTKAFLILWRLPRGSLPQSCKQVQEMMSMLCQVAISVTAVILLIFVPWYSTASYYFGTYTHQYAWVVSASFVSGLAPGLVNFFFWSGLILFGVTIAVSVAHKTHNEELPPVTVRSSSSMTKVVGQRTVSLLERAKAYSIFLSLNLIAVIGANIAFVYVSLNESSAAVQLAQVALSLWKFAWNTVCVPVLINQLSRRVMPAKQSSGFFRVHAFVSLFNNIAIPCLVVAAQSPSCFLDLLFPPSPLISSYAVQQCQITPTGDSNIDVQCFQAESAVQQTDYTPGFTYSYECSSSFVTYYSASLIYLALTAGVIVPAGYCLLGWVANQTAPESTLHKWFMSALPRLWKFPELEPASSSAHANYEGHYMNANNLIVNMTVYLGLLLSFGVVFPPVALAMYLAMLSTAYQTYLAVGRLLVNARELGAGHVVVTLEADCKHAATVKKFRSLVIMVTAFACSFYALFIFDTVGDAEGFSKACWALILMPLLPAGLYTVKWFMRSEQEQQERHQSPQNSSAQEEESFEMVIVQGKPTPGVDNGQEERGVSSGVIVSALHG